MHPVIGFRWSLTFATRVVLLAAFVGATLVVVTRSRAAEGHPGAVSAVLVANSDHCEKACNDTFIQAVQDECSYHKRAVKECGANFVCHRDENYRHRTALQAILAGHKTCRSGCSPQAAGTAGT